MARTAWSQSTYEMVADAIRTEWTPETNEAMENLAEEFAVRFSADSPKFDRSQFMLAIGFPVRTR